VSVQPLVTEAAILIEKETSALRIYKKANIEYRILNFECRKNEFFLFYKKDRA